MKILTALPVWLSGVLLVGLGTVFAMLGPIVVRRRIGLERLATNNEVAGFKFATVGVLYAVLLAFVIVVVWEKFNDAEREVSHEAGACATLYRLTDGMEAAPAAAVRDALRAYLGTAVAQDWPAMEQGHGSPATRHALDGVYRAVLAYRPADRRGEILLAELLSQLDDVTVARRDRLTMAAGIVPGVIWLVLFGGAVLTVGFTFFFATRNLAAQSLMTGLLAALIFSGLLVIVVVCHPFLGDVKVGPEALEAVLTDFAAAQ